MLGFDSTAHQATARTPDSNIFILPAVMRGFTRLGGLFAVTPAPAPIRTVEPTLAQVRGASAVLSRARSTDPALSQIRSTTPTLTK
jgi:alpha/beta superfamily hydrolase